MIIREREKLADFADSIQAIESDFADDPAGSLKRLISRYRQLTLRQRVLAAIEKSRTEEVPWSLVPSVERICKCILPERPVLVTMKHQMTYEVTYNEDGNGRIILHLPLLHRANAFMHVLIGHELFHPAIADFLKEAWPDVGEGIHVICDDVLKHEEPDHALFQTRRLDELVTRAHRIWKRGVEEFMCDIGAAALFGPAALWTMSGYASSSDLDTDPTRNDSYPPWRKRLSVVYDHVVDNELEKPYLDSLYSSLTRANQHDHLDAIKRSIASEKAIIDATPSAPHDVPDEFTSRIYEFVYASLSQGKKVVSDIANKIPNRWGTVVTQVPALVKRLEHLVPPCEVLDKNAETSPPAELSAIVLACWIERLRLEQKHELNLTTYSRLCRLMLKAIEDAELKRAFLSREGHSRCPSLQR
ncbi:hypothetical protein [Planctomycetes bacterium Pan216]